MTKREYSTAEYSLIFDRDFKDFWMTRMAVRKVFRVVTVGIWFYCYLIKFPAEELYRY